MEEKTVKQGEILKVTDLVVEYTSDNEIVHAVNGVSFKLNYGQTLGIVGETGAGKTSIARAILRILPHPPAILKQGTIELDGENLLMLPEHQMGKIRGDRVSMIFQDPMSALDPILRIGEQIADGIRIHQKLSKAKSEELAKQMLELVGISRERFREYPHQFSGGMKQRVVIAIALACNPDLLIADEPTSALDVTIQAQVMELIKDLQSQRGTSMILITHDFGIVAENCDTVAVMYGGQIVEYGTKRDIFKRCCHPYTVALFKTLPSMNDDVKRLTPTKGSPVNPVNLPTGCCFHPRCEFANDKCKEIMPDLTDVGDGHLCRCHYHEKVLEAK